MGYKLDSGGGWEGAAVEWNAAFAAVHNANNRHDYCFEHKMTVEAPLPDEFPLDQPYHHLSAGPPCQPYSRAGKGLGASDERDGIPAVLKAIAILHPTVVEIENVPTLLRFTDVVQGMRSTLKALGYHVTSYQLNAADYGVPQKRVRLLVVGSLLGPLDAPPPGEGPVITVRDAIGEQSGFDAFRAYDAQLALTEEQKMRAERLDIMAGCVNFRELHPDEPARTLTASNLANNHGLMLRLRMEDGVTLQRPSVEQAAALQSFPIDFEFSEAHISRRQAYIAVGNAMPTQLGLHLTRVARQQLQEAQDAYATLVKVAEGAARSQIGAVGETLVACNTSVAAGDSTGERSDVENSGCDDLRVFSSVEHGSDLSAPDGGASLRDEAVEASAEICASDHAESDAAPPQSKTVRIFAEWLLTMAAVSA
ncbi:MAG: DNA cytosine methyltransferase, partial [Luminiphilus sp.]